MVKLEVLGCLPLGPRPWSPGHFVCRRIVGVHKRVAQPLRQLAGDVHHEYEARLQMGRARLEMEDVFYHLLFVYGCYFLEFFNFRASRIIANQISTHSLAHARPTCLAWGHWVETWGLWHRLCAGQVCLGGASHKHGRSSRAELLGYAGPFFSAAVHLETMGFRKSPGVMGHGGAHLFGCVFFLEGGFVDGKPRKSKERLWI